MPHLLQCTVLARFFVKHLNSNLRLTYTPTPNFSLINMCVVCTTIVQRQLLACATSMFMVTVNSTRGVWLRWLSILPISIRKTGFVNLFEGVDGYENGAQLRDFVSVEDVVDLNLFLFANPSISGIFNVGTGRCQSFNDVAVATINRCRTEANEEPLDLQALQQKNIIRYIEFPEALKGKYQSFTEADISALRTAGYEHKFLTVEKGVSRYVGCLLDKLTQD